MKHLVLCLITITGLIITGCSHTSELTGDNVQDNEKNVNYSVIYYIHADSDYLYHNPDRQPVKGNSEVLETAFEVGEAARSGEVLIYHQQRERKLLGLFPRRSSRFYHYKYGQLVNRVKFRHQDKKEDFLATEVQLMNQYRAHSLADNHQNYFLYFGHEIPTETGKGYHRSQSGIDVNTASFAKGLQNFLLADDDRFSLVVLSTCNNGTPAMAELLIPFADAMLASPQNLHLSHIDSDRMNLLEIEPEISPLQLGHSMAEKTYQRLEATVHTTITLALYDFKDIRDYIHTLTPLTALNNTTDRSVQFQDNIDCAQINPLEFEFYRQGVETWYKPARFGRQSGKSDHSGWGCKPINED